MEEYRDFKPTEFDNHIYLEDREDWLVVPVSRTRDSGVTSDSNFESALKLLGGERDGVEIHRFGHWGPGWFEILIIDNTNEDLVRIGEDIERSLADYPILDEMDLFSREAEEREESWDNWVESEFVSGIEEKFEGFEVYDYEIGDNKFDTRKLFDMITERENIDWETESDDSQTIDVPRIVNAVTLGDLAEFTDEFNEHYVDPNQIVMNF